MVLLLRSGSARRRGTPGRALPRGLGRKELLDGADQFRNGVGFTEVRIRAGTTNFLLLHRPAAVPSRGGKALIKHNSAESGRARMALPPDQDRDRPLLSRMIRPPNGCRLYDGPINDKGYGVATRHRQRHARQSSGPPPHHRPLPRYMYSCHPCDNPPCCNPARALPRHGPGQRPRRLAQRPPCPQAPPLTRHRGLCRVRLNSRTALRLSTGDRTSRERTKPFPCSLQRRPTRGMKQSSRHIMITTRRSGQNAVTIR